MVNEKKRHSVKLTGEDIYIAALRTRNNELQEKGGKEKERRRSYNFNYTGMALTTTASPLSFCSQDFNSLEEREYDQENQDQQKKQKKKQSSGLNRVKVLLLFNGQSRLLNDIGLSRLLSHLLSRCSIPSSLVFRDDDDDDDDVDRLLTLSL